MSQTKLNSSQLNYDQPMPDNANTTASETQKGIVEIATNAEVLTGTDISRVVTPKTLKDNYDMATPFVVNREKNSYTAGVGGLTIATTPVNITKKAIITVKMDVSYPTTENANIARHIEFNYSTDGVNYTTIRQIWADVDSGSSAYPQSDTTTFSMMVPAGYYKFTGYIQYNSYDGNGGSASYEISYQK